MVVRHRRPCQYESPRQFAPCVISSGWKHTVAVRRNAACGPVPWSSREAVKLATQPDSNSTRTFKRMSTFGDRMGNPTARTSRTGEWAKSQHDVQVMDHQVQHHIHVERAGREDGKPVRLEEHGPFEFWLNGKYGGVKALQVARLDNAFALVAPFRSARRPQPGSPPEAFRSTGQAPHRAKPMQRHGGGPLELQSKVVGLRSAESSSSTEEKTGIAYFAAASAARAVSGSTAATSATPSPRVSIPAASSSRYTLQVVLQTHWPRHG